MSRIITAIFILFLFVQCKQETIQEVEKKLPGDFEVFFEKFHSDSTFQLEHIVFPLEGSRKAKGNQIDIMTPYIWEKENWILHRPFNDFNGNFERSYHMIGTVIMEKIEDKNKFFSMERRFAKMDKEWHLIYYGVNN